MHVQAIIKMYNQDDLEKASFYPFSGNLSVYKINYKKACQYACVLRLARGDILLVKLVI